MAKMEPDVVRCARCHGAIGTWESALATDAGLVCETCLHSDPLAQLEKTIRLLIQQNSLYQAKTYSEYNRSYLSGKIEAYQNVLQTIQAMRGVQS